MVICIYAAVDLNLVDGSSIWLASIAEVASHLPGSEILVLSRTDLTRDIVTYRLNQRSNVRILNPYQPADELTLIDKDALTNLDPRQSPKQALSILKALDAVANIDLYIIRDDILAELIGEEADLVGKSWVYVCNPLNMPAEHWGRLRSVLPRFARSLCQTRQVKSIILEAAPNIDPKQVILCPPMVPNWTGPTKRTPNVASPKLGYSGKFAPLYNAMEQLEAFAEIKERLPTAQFHLAGDKFHNAPPVRNFENRLRNTLTTMPGVIWHGGATRDDTMAIMAEVDVAASWRHPSFDSNPEISTKVLEYASIGLPVLMNAAEVNIDVFGAVYPGFVCSKSEFVDTFVQFVSNRELYQSLSAQGLRIAQDFSFEMAYERLAPELKAMEVRGRQRAGLYGRPGFCRSH